MMTMSVTATNVTLTKRDTRDDNYAAADDGFPGGGGGGGGSGGSDLGGAGRDSDGDHCSLAEAVALLLLCLLLLQAALLVLAVAAHTSNEQIDEALRRQRTLERRWLCQPGFPPDTPGFRASAP